MPASVHYLFPWVRTRATDLSGWKISRGHGTESRKPRGSMLLQSMIHIIQCTAVAFWSNVRSAALTSFCAEHPDCELKSRPHFVLARLTLHAAARAANHDSMMIPGSLHAFCCGAVSFLVLYLPCIGRFRGSKGLALPTSSAQSR